MIYTFYESASGRIVGKYSGPNVTDQQSRCGDGIACIEGDFDGTHIVDGQAVTIAAIEPMDLVISQARAISVINAVAGETILARLPDWRQRNLTARALELLYASATGSIEWLEIQAQWDWVKAVRAASNIATANVETAADPAEIDAAVAEFHTALEAFQ